MRAGATPAAWAKDVVLQAVHERGLRLPGLLCVHSISKMDTGNWQIACKVEYCYMHDLDPARKMGRLRVCFTTRLQCQDFKLDGSKGLG